MKRTLVASSAVVLFALSLASTSLAAKTGRADSFEVPIEAKSGSKLVGTATFKEVPEGVHVVVDVSGILTRQHGVHVHEKGDCSSADAKSG